MGNFSTQRSISIDFADNSLINASTDRKLKLFSCSTTFALNIEPNKSQALSSNCIFRKFCFFIDPNEGFK